MSGSLNAFLTALASTVTYQRGEELRKLLSVSNQHALEAVRQRSRGMPGWDANGMVREEMRRYSLRGSGWDDIFAQHCTALGALLAGRAVDAYAQLVAYTQPFLKLFREDKDAWLVPVMCGMVHNLRDVARQADAETRRSGKSSDALDNCGTLMQSCFRTALQATGNKEKKLALLEIINTLFKVYFQLNTLRLCKTLINAVASKQFLEFDMFPASQRVTYRYFTGRLNIFDEKYQEAVDDLTYAFEHCPRGAEVNKARCAYYLVPARMLLGDLPRQAMLQRFNLHHYVPIVEAMREGSIQRLDSCLRDNQYGFIQAGTFLLVEKLKLFVHRRLFKRVALLHRVQDPAKADRLPLVKVQQALAWQGVDIDLDGVECIAANLIYRKLVKGYLSHQHRIAVLSKQDPFPALSAATLTDP
ncbi:hypothetical protein CVIRNUC_007176 [Coccomyxa viridis]|uniref:PCI domain-containing protein n=1 Tax=Coccomyxa viridis TaxID=1274662 RepID=A0AAV1IDJ7_9CHLO|nr:hypothetical protein CVIRNUC_007176 [Coccomyxa viridis]